jgi:uncharacterized protein YecT (DUF1311 family)
LNVFYNRLLERMHQVDRRIESRKPEHRDLRIALLVESERVWKQYREAQCKAAVNEYAGGDMAPMIHWQCIAELTKQRTRALQDIYQDAFH